MIGKYKIIEKLGKGGFGTAYMAINTENDKIVTIKIIDMIEEEDYEDVKREIKYLRILDCYPHVSCYYDSEYIGNTAIVEMEYIDGYGLQEYINFYDVPFKYDLCLRIIRIINQSLIYIHSKNILHLDLKPENILINKNGLLKIIDFGISCTKKINDKCNEPCCVSASGTSVYMAPETYYIYLNYKATDIWLMGATIYKLITGKYIRNDEDIKNGVYDEVTILNTGNELLDYIVNSCLKIDHQSRITSQEIKSLLKDYK